MPIAFCRAKWAASARAGGQGVGLLQVLRRLVDALQDLVKAAGKFPLAAGQFLQVGSVLGRQLFDFPAQGSRADPIGLGADLPEGVLEGGQLSGGLAEVVPPLQVTQGLFQGRDDLVLVLPRLAQRWQGIAPLRLDRSWRIRPPRRRLLGTPLLRRPALRRPALRRLQVLPRHSQPLLDGR